MRSSSSAPDDPSMVAGRRGGFARLLPISLAFCAATTLGCDRIAPGHERALPQMQDHPLVGAWSQPLWPSAPQAIDHAISATTWQRSFRLPDQTPSTPGSDPVERVAFEILAVDTATQRLLGRWHPQSWHPNRFVAVEWQIADETLLYCDLAVDALSAEQASAVKAADRDSLQIGCLGTPWRPLHAPAR